MTTPAPPRREALQTPGTRIRIEVGSAYELIGSALTIADPEGGPRFADIEEWRALASDLPEAARETLVALGPHPVINMLGLALDLSGPRTAAGLLANLASAPPLEIVRTAIGRYRRTVLRDTPGEVIDDALDGNEAAKREFLASSWPEVDVWQAGIRFLLSAPPDDIGGRLRYALESWYETGFAGELERLDALQARERATLLAESPAWRLEPLLRRAVPNVEYVPPPGVEGVTFVPTIAIRPSFLFLDHRMEALVLFPVRPERDEDAPPEELALIGKALGDELRLRVLRALANGPRSHADLSAELNVPRTSLGHHIGVLRAAGLVGFTIDDGRYGRLTLRTDALARLTPLLRDLLGDRGPER